MITLPLLKLFVENLTDAQALGLIDTTNPDVGRFVTNTRTKWDKDPSSDVQVQTYNNHMLNAKQLISHAHIPLQAHRGKRIRVTHVRPFGRFADWITKITGERDTFDFKSLRTLDGLKPENVNKASEACLRLSNKFGVSHAAGKGRGKLFRVQSIQPIDYSFWVGNNATKRHQIDAQYWRDKLGLIHLAGQSKPSIADKLVKVELEIETSNTLLNKGDLRTQLDREPTGVWLIRPAPVHRGNHRFVQRHKLDYLGAPSRQGRTRDLSSTFFEPSERESLLVYGNLATIRFRGVELLTGYPVACSGKDNSDLAFVTAISKERGW
jgi:hypothetical protein